MDVDTQLIVRYYGRSSYEPLFQQMRSFTLEREDITQDECWLVEHEPVFTQGQAGKPEHIFDPGEIPVIQTDRGGQVTYHGPGQLVLYTLIDIKRKNLGIKNLVCALERAVIQVLETYQITGTTVAYAPGVYVEGAKICSLGLRIRKGCSYHGLSFNIDMDLEPFARIRPCGLEAVKIAQLRDFIETANLTEVSPRLINSLAEQLGYQTVVYKA